MYESTPRGFFSSLMDISFHEFVTPKIITVVYLIALICLGIWALVFLASGFATSFFGGPSLTSIVFHIIGAALAFVLGAIAIRIQLEFVLAVFRIAENTAPR